MSERCLDLAVLFSGSGRTPTTRIVVGLAILPLTPLIFHLGSQDGFHLPKLLATAVLTSLLLVLWCLRSLRSSSASLELSTIHWPFFCLFAASALTFPWFAVWHPDIKAPYLWGIAFLSFVLLAAHLGDRKSIHLVVASLLLAGTLMALYGFLQYIGIDLPQYGGKGMVVVHSFPLGRWGTPFSTLGNPNFLAEYLAGTLPLACALLVGVRRRRLRLLLAISTALMFSVLILAQARAAWLGLLSGAVFLLFQIHRLGFKRRKAIAVTALGTAAVLLILSTGMVPGSSRGWNKVVATLSFEEESIGARLFWWRVTGEIIKDHPFLGIGTARFREVYPAYQRAFFEDPRNLRFAKFTGSDVSLEAPHNQYLHTTAELGFLGLAYLLWLIVAIFTAGFSALRRADVEVRPVLLGCLAGLLALLVDGFFSYPFAIPSSLLLFSILAGLIAAEARVLPQRVAGSEWQPLKGRLWTLVLLTLTLFSCLHSALLIKVYASSLHLHRGTEQLLRDDFHGAAASLERALDLSPRDLQIPITLANAYAALGRTGKAIEMADRGKGAFSSPFLYRFLGNLRYDLGDYVGAETEYREGISTFPGNAPLLAAYGALLAKRGCYQEARARLDQARALDPRYPDTYHYLGRLFYVQNRFQESLLTLRQFLRLAPLEDPRRGSDQELISRIEQGPGS